jgi:hypothetical protein
MASGVTPEQEEELRDFVRRHAEAFGIDPDKAWRDHCQKVIKKGWEWFVRVRDEQARLAADHLASRDPGRNSTPRIQWPGVETAPAPPPTFRSFDDYLARTSAAKRKAKCSAAAQKANRKRLLSSAPEVHLTGKDVWAVFEAAKGRCAHCGSLAVEGRPSKPNGAPLPWAQIGRRIGSFEHLEWRIRGGGNDLSNLAWSCLWCNTWPGERRPGATDHGGFYPDPVIKPDPKISKVAVATKRGAKRPPPIGLDDDEDVGFEMFRDHEHPEATAMWRDTFWLKHQETVIERRSSADPDQRFGRGNGFAGRIRTIFSGIGGIGFHPAIALTCARAIVLSVTPRNSRRNSMAAESSPSRS